MAVSGLAGVAGLAPARAQTISMFGPFSLIQSSQAVNTSRYGTLPGFSYVGEISGTAPVVGTVYIPLRNLPLLYYYAVASNEPGSPIYGHYLTRQQVAELFYPVLQFNSLVSELRAEGLRILFTAADSLIVFEGPAAKVEALTGARIGLFSNGSWTYYEALGPASLDGFPVYISNVTAVLFNRPRFLLTLGSYLSRVGALGHSQLLSAPLEAYNLTQLAGAYNATSLYSLNDTGLGVSVGILDFYGSPYVAQTLAYFDRLYGLPSPPNFSVVPIGAYNPNLGVFTGWNYEIDLDIETVHAIAPGASIVLYVASGSLPLSAAIAFIDQQDQVSIVSQSFGVPESLFSNLGFEFYTFNVYLTDVYYALGAAEGITFVAASGDGGGMGYSVGPIGGVTYPSSSPFVLAVGGTSTYLDFGPGNQTSYEQTAWSSMGFVPYLSNLGGSTGGFSAWEPMPWYQEGVVPRPPDGFPYGRAVPDVSANANVIPGVYATFDGNITAVTGGTSEASPLVAALLALVEQRVGHRLGLLNPILYELYENPLTNNTFTPITFGYNIPWVAGPGYNLVTGLGTINAGLLAYYLAKETPTGPATLLVKVYVNGTGLSNSTILNILPGDKINVSALVEYPNGSVVSEGRVSLKVVTPEGIVTYSLMEFNKTTGLWTAVITAPATGAGNSLIEVNASEGNMSGVGVIEAYLGYFVSFDYPVADEAWSSSIGIPLIYMITTLNGTPASQSLSYTVDVLHYRPVSNEYYLEYSKQMSGAGFTGELISNESVGGMYLLEIVGPALGYVPFMDGIGLQTMYVLPQVIIMPGDVGQGSYIIIVGLPSPPQESYELVSQQLGTLLSTAIEYGSNITALLVSPSGQVISSAVVPLNESGYYLGELYVPPNASPGLYWVLLKAIYNSTTEGPIVGEGVGMIYVSPPVKAEVWAEPAYPSEGQPVTVYANITLGGAEVTYGAFSATLTPLSASYLYGYATQYIEVPLYFNRTLGLWTGVVELPSPFSSGSAAAFDGLYVGQPWLLVVSGEGAQGGALPWASATVMQTRYIFYSHEDLSFGNFYPYYGLFNDVNITFNGTIYDSVFDGIDYIVNSDLVIQGSDIKGLLVLVHSNATLIDVNANYIAAFDSNVTLISSWVRSLELLNGSKMRFVGPVVYVFAGNQSSLLQDLEELWSYVKRINSELLSYVEQLRLEIAQVNATLSAKVLEVEALASAYGSEAQKFQAEIQQLTGFESAVSLVESNITVRVYNLSSALSSVKAQVTNLTLNESRLAAEVSEISNNMSSTGPLVSQIAARLSSISGQLDQLENQVEELSYQEERLSEAQSSVASMTSFSVWLSVAAVLAMITVLTASYYALRRLRPSS